MVLNLGKGYSPRFGRCIDQMPILIAAGETPMGVDHVLERHAAFPDVWRSTYVYSGDTAIRGVKGDALIELDSLLLRSVNEKSNMIIGTDLVLSVEEWEEKKLNKDNLYLTAEQVLEAYGRGYVEQNGIWKPENHAVAEVWNTLGRGRDLHEYAKLTSSKSDGAKQVMKVYFANHSEDVPTMRAWCVNTLRTKFNLYCARSTHFDLGHLIGVAPEALAAYKERVAYQKR